MSNQRTRAITASFLLAMMVSGCSADGKGGVATRTGGDKTAKDNGGGGGNPARGGASGTEGSAPGLGGTSGAGGATLGSSGRFEAGGDTVAVGGKLAASGGVHGDGGAKSGGGGDPSSRGGAYGEGGSLARTGGAGPASGGQLGTGGSGTGGPSLVDPDTSAAINACMDKLPWGAHDMSASERAPIVAAIVNACAQFAPAGTQWQTYCQMFLVGAINAESSYNVQAGTAGAGSDPTVGLLQIRFSSTVRDFADYGPVDALARAGCNFGTVTSSDSYATKSAMMVDVNCNVAIGAWYYFIFGSGNGGPKVVWVREYCQEDKGVAGNLHIGMACHLMGAEAAHSSLSGADSYYNNIKSWFDPCVSYSGTHPFELAIEPDTAKYCR